MVFTDQASVWQSNVSRLLQSWNRFILQQIQKEVADDLFEDLYGLRQKKVNLCTKCKKLVETKDTVLLCNLLYPSAAESFKEKVTFEDVVSSSLSAEQTTPAWCEDCRKYQTTQQSRRMISLPSILTLNAGMDNAQDVEFWRHQMELLLTEKVGATAADEEQQVKKEEEVPVAPAPPPNVKPCRYGSGCNRPDCKFWHTPSLTAGENAETVEDNVGDKLYKHKLSWVPHTMKLRVNEAGKVIADDEGDD